MFTGIIEEIGVIKDIKKSARFIEFQIFAEKVTDDLKVGDSISIDGACQTVINKKGSLFKVQSINETLMKTLFKKYIVGSKVNLERAMIIQSRLGGHILTGHIDCVGKINKILKLNSQWEIIIDIPGLFNKYLVNAGSVALNGISLTVSKLFNNSFKVSIINHTFKNTNIQYFKTGDSVNLEFDILGKYVAKLLDERKK